MTIFCDVRKTNSGKYNDNNIVAIILNGLRLYIIIIKLCTLIETIAAFSLEITEIRDKIYTTYTKRYIILCNHLINLHIKLTKKLLKLYNIIIFDIGT